MRILFYARDVRGGLGERRVFNVIIRHLADHIQEDDITVDGSDNIVQEYLSNPPGHYEPDYDRDYDELERQLAELQETLTPVEERDLTIYEELLAKDDWKELYNALNRESKRAFWRKYIKAIKLDTDGKLEEIIFF